MTILKFAVAGSIGYVVDTGILLFFNSLLGPYLARAISFFSAMTTTWLINRKITFTSAINLNTTDEFFRYSLTSLGGGAINLFTYSILIKTLSPPTSYLPIIVAFSSISGMMVNYTLAKKLIYTQSK